MDILINKLCSIQGRLFELSVDKGYDSENFINVYMKSIVAKKYNSKYDFLQWAGEEYILDLIEEKNLLLKGHTYSKDVMFWIGYVYCYWHYRTTHECKEIVEIAPPKIMSQNYYALHTIEKDLAIENLIQLSMKKKTKLYFKYISKQQIEHLLTTVEEKEYIKAHNSNNLTRLTYIQNVLDLIDESNWNFIKKIEHKVIINQIKDNIINYGFNEINYNYLDKLYNELYSYKE